MPFAALASYPLILPGREHGLRDSSDRLAREQRLSLNVRIEIDALSQLKSLVQHGIDHTLLPWPAVRDAVKRGELIATPIVEPVIERTLYVAQASDRPGSRATTATVTLLTGCLRELANAQDDAPSINPIGRS